MNEVVKVYAVHDYSGELNSLLIDESMADIVSVDVAGTVEEGFSIMNRDGMLEGFFKTRKEAENHL